MSSIHPNLNWKRFFLKEKNSNDIKVILHNAIYFDSARSALLGYLKSENIKKGDKVLLPSFMCESIILPITKIGCEIEFYDVDDNFLPLIDKISDDVKILFLLNFFSLLDEKSLLPKVKMPRDIKIIYDFAHSMPMPGIVGYKCDAIIYSLYKCLPLFDGGVLISKKNFFLKFNKQKLFVTLKKIIKKIINYTDNILPISLINILLNFKTIYTFVYRKNVLKFDEAFQISKISLYYLKKFSFNEEYLIRKKNYTLLLRLFEKNKPEWIEKVYELHENSSPIFFPILVKNKSICEDITYKMRKMNISPGIFWPKPSIVNVESKLYDRIIVLPIHGTFETNKIIQKMKFL